MRKMKLILFLLAFGGSVIVDADVVTQLREDNWNEILTGEWMIEFYAPWCPACRALQSAWEEFATWTDDLNLKGIAQIDVTRSPGLSGRFMVTALPTIFHVKDGEFRQYRGARDKDSFISFIEDKKWTEIEKISAWKDPRSIQMTLVSYFFKMSMFLRNIHAKVTEEYGFPYWVSYVGFALCTIIIGAILGLLLVCCIDCIYPPGKQTLAEEMVPPHPDKKEEDDDDDEDYDPGDLPDGDEDEETEKKKKKEEEEEEDAEVEKENQTVRKRRAKKVE